MNLKEAYSVLDVDQFVDSNMLKQNYKWLIKLYHPDNKEHGDKNQLFKVIKAYNLILLERFV